MGNEKEKGDSVHPRLRILAPADRCSQALFMAAAAIQHNANHEFLGLKRDLLAQAGRLYEITIPVSAVHGDMDSLVPAANSYYLQQKLVNAALDMEILKQKDHFIPWSSKSVIDQSLERLIERVRRTEQQGCR